MFEMFHRMANVETPLQPSRKPFLIELQQQEKTPSGSFVPASRLQLNPSFRTSGPLLALPPEELKSLLFLLTSVSPNGDCRALLPQLAAAMHLATGRARLRMQRLLSFRWHGEPLVLQTKAESGLVTYVLHPRLVDYVHAEEPEEEAEAPRAVQAASRQAVIEYSRGQYARIRAEAEREIARQLGHKVPDENIEGNVSPESNALSASTALSNSSQSAHSLRRRLENNGLTTEQADRLLLTYSW